MNARIVLKAVVAALAVLLVVGVLTFAGPCVHADGSSAACHPAQTAIIVAGAVAAVCALASLFARYKRAAASLLLIAAVAGVAALLVPGILFPMCLMNTMRCHMVMQPFAQLFGAVLAAVALIAAIRCLHAPGR